MPGPTNGKEKKLCKQVSHPLGPSQESLQAKSVFSASEFLQAVVFEIQFPVNNRKIKQQKYPNAHICLSISHIELLRVGDQ